MCGLNQQRDCAVMHQDKSPNSVPPTVPNAQLSYRVSSDDKMQCDKINADQTNKIEVISDAIISTPTFESKIPTPYHVPEPKNPNKYRLSETPVRRAWCGILKMRSLKLSSHSI